MILDKAENLKLYEGAHKYVKACADFIASHDMANLECKKYEIFGDELFCKVSEYQTAEPKLFEAHDKYLDLQYIIKGTERMDYADRAKCTQEGAYNEGKDVVFFSKEKYSPLTVEEGMFAIFFPDDAHRPGVMDERAETVKKAVFKIKI